MLETSTDRHSEETLAIMSGSTLWSGSSWGILSNMSSTSTSGETDTTNIVATTMAPNLTPENIAIVALLIIIILLIIVTIVIIIFVLLYFRRRQKNVKKIVKWKEGIVEVMEVNKLEDDGQSEEKEKGSSTKDEPRDEFHVETAADLHVDADVDKSEAAEERGGESDTKEKERGIKEGEKNGASAELGAGKLGEASVKMEEEKVSGDKTECKQTKDELPDKATVPESQQKNNKEDEVEVKSPQMETSVNENSPPATVSVDADPTVTLSEEKDSNPEAKVADGGTKKKEENTVEKSPSREKEKATGHEQDLKSTSEDLPDNKDSAI